MALTLSGSSTMSLSTTWALCVLVLVVEPHFAQSSSRGSFMPNKALVSPPPLTHGICASLVIIHGYECQELQVIINTFIPA